jgi:hypothetical protein
LDTCSAKATDGGASKIRKEKAGHSHSVHKSSVAHVEFITTKETMNDSTQKKKTESTKLSHEIKIHTISTTLCIALQHFSRSQSKETEESSVHAKVHGSISVNSVPNPSLRQ